MLDVTDTASIQAAAPQLGEDGCALYALVDNAGISVGAPTLVADEDVEHMRAMFDLNTLGPVLVS